MPASDAYPVLGESQGLLKAHLRRQGVPHVAPQDPCRTGASLPGKAALVKAWCHLQRSTKMLLLVSAHRQTVILPCTSSTVLCFYYGY